MRLLKIAAGALAAGLLAGAAVAEDFPGRTFDDLATQDLKLIQEQKKTPAPGDLFFNPGADAGARTLARFTGQSRPIDARVQGFIIAFASTGPGNGGYAGLFRREYRFEAGGKTYWLPVQDQVASYFARELAPGDTVTLYLRNAGGFRDAQAWQWVYLVEEFQSAKTPRKANPPGPKTQT